MARVTVEDCVLQVPNRFELVMLAAHRAKALGSGAELKVDRDRDKNPVVALREIAEEKLPLDVVRESLVKGLQKHVEPDQIEEEVTDLMANEQQSWINADLGGMDGDDEDEGEDETAADNGMDGNVQFEDADIRE